jgi:putative ABC transport system permease protein
MLCLTIGIVTLLFIINYIAFERSYDNFHEHAKNIYRAEYRVFKDNELYQNWVPSVFPLGPTLKDKFPEVIEYTRIRDPGYISGEHVVSYKDRIFHEDKIFFVDQSFLKIFSFKMIKGNPDAALSIVKSVILTESTAKKYFGNEDPINKLMKFIHKKKEYICKVTGIIKDVPENSHIKFSMLVSLETYFFEHNSYHLQNNWTRQAVSTYLLLSPDAVSEFCEVKFNDYIYQYLPEWKKKKFTIKYALIPLRDIHLFGDSDFDQDKHINYKSLYHLLIIALLIFVISWINYNNLSYFKAVEKVKEIERSKGLRDYRNNTFFQLLLESFLFYGLSIVISLFLFYIFQPYVSQLSGKNLPVYFVFYWYRFIMLVSNFSFFFI